MAKDERTQIRVRDEDGVINYALGLTREQAEYVREYLSAHHHAALPNNPKLHIAVMKKLRWLIGLAKEDDARPKPKRRPKA